jgi:hypothetical protein
VVKSLNCPTIAISAFLAIQYFSVDIKGIVRKTSIETRTMLRVGPVTTSILLQFTPLFAIRPSNPLTNGDIVMPGEK